MRHRALHDQAVMLAELQARHAGGHLPAALPAPGQRLTPHLYTWASVRPCASGERPPQHCPRFAGALWRRRPAPALQWRGGRDIQGWVAMPAMPCVPPVFGCCSNSWCSLRALAPHAAQHLHNLLL